MSVDAADLHVDLLLSELQIDVSLPKIPERFPPSLYFFFRECGLASPGAEFLFAIMV